MVRRSLVPSAVPWIAAAVLIAASVRLGRSLQDDQPEVFLGAAPLVGQDPLDGWDWRFGWGLVGAAAVASLLMWCVWTGRWSTWPMRVVLAVTSATAGAFAVLLALTDGRRGLLRGADHETEYLANLDIAPGPRAFVRDFVADIQQYSVHVRGHPPGFVLLLQLLDSVDLTGAWPVVGVSLVGTIALPLAVLSAVRTIGDDDWARRVAPFLAVSPYALWMMTSADALFAACGALSIAACLRAVGADGRVAFVWGAVSGSAARRAAVHDVWRGDVLVGTRGADDRGMAPARCGARPGRRRRHRCGRLVTGVFAAFGFWWLDGARETRRQYWAGTAQFRPFGYFLIANLAVALIAIGPVGFGGLLALWRRRRCRRRSWRGRGRGAAGAAGVTRIAVHASRGRADLAAVLSVAARRSGRTGDAHTWSCDSLADRCAGGMLDRPAGVAGVEVVSRSVAFGAPERCGRELAHPVGERHGGAEAEGRVGARPGLANTWRMSPNR